MNKENLNELLNSKTEDNATEIIIEVFDAVVALIENDDLKELSEPQKNFYLNHIFEMENHNGGITQFFGNVPQYAQETVQSLKVIGAKKNAELLQKAIAKFPNATVPTDFHENLDQVDAIDDEIWDEFDDKFYEYRNEEDLITLNLNYIRESIDRW